MPGVTYRVSDTFKKIFTVGLFNLILKKNYASFNYLHEFFERALFNHSLCSAFFDFVIIELPLVILLSLIRLYGLTVKITDC